MRRTRTLCSTARVSVVPQPLEEVWAVTASGRTGPQWYVDAAPFVFRGAVDRLVGGDGRRWEPPGTDLLQAGDRAGFWEVTAAEHDGDGRRLVLEARVRAPGLVRLTTTARRHGPASTELEQVVSLRPHGLAGAVYLVVDLPAREAVTELTHRRLVGDLA
jgi:hypothetical protein